MKVIANTLGFYGGSRRRPGDVFEVPDGTKGKWFTPADKAKPKGKAKPEDKSPETLSELAHAEHKAQGDDALV
jgi:hypothetical protein